MAHKIQVIVDSLKSEGLGLDHIRPLLEHSSAFVRSHAIEALIRQISKHPEVLDEVIAAIRDPSNSARLMGTISVALVAIAALFRSDCPLARAAGSQLALELPIQDREDLHWFLRSEGLAVS